MRYLYRRQQNSNYENLQCNENDAMNLTQQAFRVRDDLEKKLNSTKEFSAQITNADDITR